MFEKWNQLPYVYRIGFFLVIGFIFFGFVVPFLGGSSDSSPEIRELIEPRLVRIPAISLFGGILEGFAYYFSTPVLMWYVGFLVLFFVIQFEAILVAYVVLWIFMPAIDFIPIDYLTRVAIH